MEYLKQLVKNIYQFMRLMTPSQAIMLIGLAAALLVSLFVVTSWLGSVNYSVLYSNLESSEAGEIVNNLTEQGIPYKLSEGGRTISIPSSDVYKVRISLASQGLPQSGNIGYAIFDQSNLGMTEFLQNLNFRRALEGELMRTIMQLSNVQAARVHIVMPKDRLFKEDRREATASVVLKLKSPGSLTRSQIAGITHLVAASVEGLTTDNISIIDYDGNLLSSQTESDKLAGLSASQLDVRKNVEQYLENKAQTMLDGLVGQGKAIVRVTAELDFQQLEKTSELYDPNSAVVRSEEHTEENKSSQDKQEQLTESTDQNKVETSITNYEINKTVEHLVNSIGNIKRLSVAVLVDGLYENSEGSGGSEESVYRPRSQDEIDRITALVKSAVGYDSGRDDHIEVVNLAFDRGSMEFEQDKLDQIYQWETIYDIAKKVGVILLVVLAFLYLRKKLKKLFVSLARIIPSAPASVPGSAQGFTSDQGPNIEVPRVEPDKRKPRLIDEMQTTAKSRPDEIAKVIKTMMAE
jgi:flagellar M-ring protein FliF